MDQRQLRIREHFPQTRVCFALLDGVEPPVEVIMVELIGKGLFPRRFDVVLALGLRHVECAVRGDADLGRQDRLFADLPGRPGVGQ